MVKGISPPRKAVAESETGSDAPSEQCRALCGSEPLPARVSLMITREQKVLLRERGYTDEQIREMKPEDAHRALGLIY